MNTMDSRSEVRRIEREHRARRRSAARRARAKDARLRRRLSQRPHWTIYLGATLLGLGVVALVVAALLTR